MRLVLLPGMDGTGNLFSPLYPVLSGFDCEVIPLPKSGKQDYLSITRFVRDYLPSEDFVLIAESFSGPIGAALAMEGIKNMKGVIFVASFLSAPNKVLLNVARVLPLKLLSSLPLAKYIYKLFFLGLNASDQLVSLLQATINDLSSHLINARLDSMCSLTSSNKQCELPVAYLQATSDKLVQSDKACEFNACFSKIIVKTIEGPHFILQVNPNACAVAISELIPFFTRSSD